MERTVDEIDAARRYASGTLTLLVCGTCGRTDRFAHLKIEGKHYALGKLCPGRPVPVTYRLDRR